MPLPFLAAIPAALGSLFASGAGALGAGAGGTALASTIGTGVGNIGMSMLPGLIGQKLGLGGGGGGPMGGGPGMGIGQPSTPWGAPGGIVGGDKPQGPPPMPDFQNGMPLGLLGMLLQQRGRNG